MISKIPYLVNRIKAKSEIILRSSIPPNATEHGLYEDVLELEKALSKPSVETPKEPLSFNCTLAKFAEQLDVPLWKAMEFGKYFKPSVVSVQDLIKCADNALGYYGIGTKMTSKEIDKVFGAIHNLITKGL